ncbi:conserved hypothetical protein [Tenacibaculum sp. 190524A05c]|uniref:hypothetical protein n=1 Tax=Tenacibaculum platacis TaxID=3137852 RepID=UPI0031FACBA1
MKNKLLLLVFLGCSFYSYSQHVYLYEYRASFSSSATGTPLYFESTISTNRGQLSSFNQTRPSSISINEFKMVEFSQEVTSVTSFARYSPGFIGGCNNITSNTNTLPFTGCIQGTQLLSGTFNAFQCLNESYNSFKLIKMESLFTLNTAGATSNELKECAPRDIKVSSGCQFKFALEYKLLGSSTWQEVIPYGSNSMTVSISTSDFPGLNVGDNFRLRARYLPTYGTTNAIAYSDEIILKSASCSPVFDNVVPSPTTCNYSSNGGFKISVKRDLDTNEKIIFTLYDGVNDAILLNQESTTSLTNNGDGTFGYEWLADLDAASYRVKYQTLNGTGNIPGTDPSWDTVEFSPVFTITKPANVVFSITSTSDENCFAVKDGYIDISASREAGRSLFYQITRDGTIQIFNGSNWVNYSGSNPDNDTYYSFSNTTTTRINKLGKGVYRVKVRDSEKCNAR